MKRRRAWLVGMGLAVLTGAAAMYLVVTTERGLLWTLEFVQRALPGELRWGAASGRLSGPLVLEDVEYRTSDGVYRSARLYLDWAPGRLLTRRLGIHALHLDDVDIALADTDPEVEHEVRESGWILPLQLTLSDLRVTALRLRRGAAAPIVIDNLHAAADSGLEWVDLQTFSVRMAQGEFNAQGRIGVGRDAASDLAVAWRATLPGYAPLAAQGRLSGGWDRLEFSQQFSAPAAARLRLEIEQPFDGLRWSARFTTPPLALNALHADWPELRIDGTLQADGDIEHYRMVLDARSAGADLPPAAVTATAHGDRAGLRIDTLRVRSLDGALEGQARVAWAPHLQWATQLQATDIDPGAHWPQWPGRLSARLHGSGDTMSGPAWTARIERLTGELRGNPVRGAGALSMNNGMLRIATVRLHSGRARLDVDGALADDWDLRWRLRAPELHQVLPDSAGAVAIDGTLTGPRAQPHLRAQAQLREFAMADLEVAELRLDADVGLQPRAALRLSAHGKTLRIAERRFDDFSIELGGRLEHHTLAMRAQGAGHGLQVSARGGWNGAQWAGRIERADWRLPELGAWQLQTPVALHVNRTRGALERTCWRQTPARLCAQFDYDARERRLRAELTDASLEQLQHGWPDTVRVDGGALAAQIDARMPVEGTAQADARIQLSAGTLSWQQGDQRRHTAFGGATAHVRLDERGVRAELETRMSGADQVAMRIVAPGYAPGKAAAQQPLQGRLRGQVRDFSLANGLVESIDELSGVLRLDALLAGTLAEPQLRGELQFTDGRMFIGPAGVQLHDWQMTISEVDADGTLQLHGSVRSGPGRLRFDGRMQGRSAADIGAGMEKGIEKGVGKGTGTEATTRGLLADLRVRGADFEAVNLPEARVLASPDLRFIMRGRTASIIGKVHIPEARIEPRDLSGAVTPSRDVLRMDAPAPTATTGWTVNSRVRLSLGEQVMFKGFGLHGRLAGGLDIVDEAGKQPRARGELAIHEGVYSAYAQELKIERGRALYRDSVLDDPGLDVRATRRSGDVLAGVRVLGTVQVPRAELYSRPPLPQADVLSYLVLGRPVAGATGSEGELLYKAASSLGLKGGNRLAQSIGRRFGIDEVAVAGTELEGAALTLGKYLSPRLYLNYSIGLIDAANRLQLRYQLTKHVAVQTETGAAAGGDVVYTIER